MATWKAECGLNASIIYPWCCGPCAAADVSEHLNKGSWMGYFLKQCILSSCLLNSCDLIVTRKQLAAQSGIQDDVGLIQMICCSPCYIGQELAHISATTGARK